MVVVGFIVSVVGMHRALQPDGSPFWRLMGLPIFSIWALFTTFYGAAMVQRKRRVYHRQLIVLASATALTAATFRVLVRFFGFTPEIAVAGCFAPLLFVAAAAVHEYRR